MTSKIAKIFVTSLLFSISAFAQKNLTEGLVVLNNRDTVKGFIDYREWYRNPENILFTPSKGAQPVNYSIRDISYFEVTGKEVYQRYRVHISMDQQLIGSIGDKDTSSRIDSVFMRIISEGKNIVLMHYTDKLKKRLYVLQKDGVTPVELRNSVYMIDGQVKEEKQYQMQLQDIAQQYLPGDIGITSLISKADYSTKKVVEICLRLNGLGKESTAKTSAVGESRLRYFAGIGLNQGALNFKGPTRFTNNNSSPYYAPIVDAGIDVFINPSVGRLFLRGQLQATTFKTDGYAFENFFASKENYYLKFRQVNISVIPQVMYNLYNKHSFKWFVGAGGGFNFSSYPVNEMKYVRERTADTTVVVYNKYLDPLKKFWLNVALRSGVVIRKLEVSLCFFPKSAISQFAPAELNNSSLQVQLNYLFK